LFEYLYSSRRTGDGIRKTTLKRKYITLFMG